MIKRIFFAGLGVLLLNGCTAYQCSMSKGFIGPDVPEYIFSNGLIRIKVASGIAGIVSGFEYLPEKKQLFEPLIYKVEKHDLLPDSVHASVTGGRELVWGVGNFGNAKMTVHRVHVEPAKTFIEMSTRFFQGENIEARKRVEIHSGTLLVDVTFTIVNRNKKMQKMSLWKHLTARITPEKRDTILIPARGGIDRVAGKAVLEMDEDVIYHDFAPEHQAVFMAPLAPWMGRCSSDGVNRGTLVMSCDEMLGPEAFFYSWKSPVNPLHTAEMVLPGCELPYRGSKTYRIRYYFFPHLKAIRALSGTTGIDIEPGFVVLENAVDVPARSLTLFCGKKAIGSYRIPALAAGEVYRIAVDTGFTGNDISLSGQWDNKERFNLPKIKESVKK